MHENYFECLCTRIMSPTYIIFYKKRATSDMNNMHKLKDIRRIFTKCRTHKQTDRQMVGYAGKPNALRLFNFVGSS